MQTCSKAKLGRWLTCAAACFAMCALSACPQGGKPGAQSKQPVAGSAAARNAAQQQADASLFATTPFKGLAPDSLDLSRDGKKVMAKFQKKDERDILVARFDLANGKLGQAEALYKSPQINRAYIAAHPSTDSCLLITNEQDKPGEPVRDVVWMAAGGTSLSLPYDKAAGIPPESPPDTRYGLTPIFSWDGEQVIVPFQHLGLCLVNIRDNKSVYVPYPEFPGSKTGMLVGALPNAGGKRLIYASMWRTGIPEDQCYVWVLDLDAQTWTKPLKLNWVVYQIGSPDALNMPWILRGSRAPQTNSEHQRLPRIGAADPLSGVVKLLEFHGDPAWPTAMDPGGKYILFMDTMRSSLARLNLDSGLLELDAKAYDPREDTKILTDGSGETVLVWNRATLFSASWDKQDKFAGLSDE